MKTSEILSRAYGLYQSMPGTYAYAKDAQGNVVSNLSEDVCQVCSLGALGRVQGVSGDNISRCEGFWELMDASAVVALEAHGWSTASVPLVNDRQPELVPKMWELAIANAKAKEECAL